MHSSTQQRPPAGSSQLLHDPWPSQALPAAGAPAAASAVAASAASQAQLAFGLDTARTTEAEAVQVTASLSLAVSASRSVGRQIAWLGMEPVRLSSPQSAAAPMPAVSHTDTEGGGFEPEADSTAGGVYVRSALRQVPSLRLCAPMMDTPLEADWMGGSKTIEVLSGAGNAADDRTAAGPGTAAAFGPSEAETSANAEGGATGMMAGWIDALRIFDLTSGGLEFKW